MKPLLNYPSELPNDPNQNIKKERCLHSQVISSRLATPSFKEEGNLISTDKKYSNQYPTSSSPKKTNFRQQLAKFNTPLKKRKLSFSPNKKYTENKLNYELEKFEAAKVKDILQDNQKKVLNYNNRGRELLLKMLRGKKINGNKAVFGKTPIKPPKNIEYSRDSLEKLVDSNSMRYFDSYKDFMHEYHQIIVAGLLAPSDKLKFRAKI